MAHRRDILRRRRISDRHTFGFCALAVAGFLTPVVAREINRRHYRADEAQLANVGLARQTALMGKFCSNLS